MMLAVEKEVVSQLVSNYNVLFESIGLGKIQIQLKPTGNSLAGSGGMSGEEDKAKGKKRLMARVSSKRFSSFAGVSPLEKEKPKSANNSETFHPPGRDRPMSFHSVNLDLSGEGKKKKKNKFSKKSKDK